MKEKEHKRPEKAYKNLKFLNSADARSIRMLSEFYEPQSRFRRYRVVDTVVFFGSARLMPKEDAERKLNEIKNSKISGEERELELKKAEHMLKMSKYYEEAVELSKRLTEWSMSLPVDEKRFIVCTGGGPGIMEAANRGASLAGGHTIGMNISLPFEQYVNKYVTPELAFEFHYFFMRKFWLVYLAKALITFPGGFGTFDELMEVLTLLQTSKIKKEMKVVVYDEKYWKKMINFDGLVEDGMINQSDLELFDFCNTVDEAFTKITGHFSKYYLNHNHK